MENKTLINNYSNKAILDKFYTKKEVALECIKQLDLSDYDFIIEPSAGNGSFFKQIEHLNKEAIDLLPEDPSIKQKNWFTYSIEEKYNNVLVIGNPPFGIRNQLSKAFILHAASFPNVKTIAFILPDVFKKHTLQKIFPLDFRLKQILDLPDEAFLLKGKPYHVPCSFFIFERSDGKCLRFDQTKYIKTRHFSFSTKDDFDFFIKGAAPARVIETPSSTNRGYFIKVQDGFSVEEIKANFRTIKWNGFSSVNGGVAWLTKAEIVKIYQEIIFGQCANSIYYHNDQLQEAS